MDIDGQPVDPNTQQSLQLAPIPFILTTRNEKRYVNMVRCVQG